MITRALTTFDHDTTDAIRHALTVQHRRIGQHDRDQRSITARNYDAAIRHLGDYLARKDAPLPSRSVLEDWRDDMQAGIEVSERGKPYAVSSINGKLAAARKLLRAVAADVTDIQVKMVLNDWTAVEDAKDTAIQDKTEDDYGKRLTLEAVQGLIDSIPIHNLKGRRDRAIIALMAGAGLRVAEVAKLTMRDVFLTTNEAGQRGIHVRQSKHNKTRVAVLGSWNSWVLDAVKAYTDALDLDPTFNPDDRVFYGLTRAQGIRNAQGRMQPRYTSNGKSLSIRGVQRAVEAYEADYNGRLEAIAAHDLRRTYAKLCRQAGMSWDAIRENMGHSSVVTTERYVGHEVDWSERVPNWGIRL